MTNQLCEKCEIEDKRSSIAIAIGGSVLFVVWLAAVWLRSRVDPEHVRGSGGRSGLQMQMESMSGSGSRDRDGSGQLSQSLFASTDSGSPEVCDFDVAFGVDLEEDRKRISVNGMLICFPHVTTLKIALRASFQPVRILITCEPACCYVLET